MFSANNYSKDERKTWANCVICNNEYEDVRLLDCSHSFCFECIKNTQKKCPICEYAIEGDVEELLPNYAVKTWQSLAPTSTESEKEEETEKISCEGCGEANGDFFCNNCALYLCANCSNSIHQLKLMKTHEIVEISQLQLKNIQNFAKCSKHTEEEKKFYCEPCGKYLCAICGIDEHFEHKPISIYKLAENLRYKWRSVVEKQITNIENNTQFQSREEGLANKIDQLTEEILFLQLKLDKLVQKKEKKEKELKETTKIHKKFTSTNHFLYKFIQTISLPIVLNNATTTRLNSSSSDNLLLLANKKSNAKKMNINDFFEEKNVEKIYQSFIPDPTKRSANQTRLQTQMRPPPMPSLSKLIYSENIDDLVLDYANNKSIDQMPRQQIDQLPIQQFPGVEENIKKNEGNNELPDNHQKNEVMKMTRIDDQIDQNDEESRSEISPRNGEEQKENIEKNEKKEKSEKSKSKKQKSTSQKNNRKRSKSLEKSNHGNRPTLTHKIGDYSEFIKKMKVIITIGKNGKGEAQFNRPSYIAINHTANLIAISDSNNHRIELFDLNLKFQQQIGGSKGIANGEFQYPRGVAINAKANYIVVADQSNHRLQYFSLKGEFLKTMGSEGTNPSQFKNPQGVAISNSLNLLAVCDCSNRRVQIFSIDGKFLYQILCNFTPYSIAICRSLNVMLVTDPQNDKVHIFNLQGRLQRSIGGTGSANGQFINPAGITIISKALLFAVSDYGNHRVQFFNLHGDFQFAIGKFDEEYQLDQPFGVAIDNKSNKFVVGEDSSSRVLLFQLPSFST